MLNATSSNNFRSAIDSRRLKVLQYIAQFTDATRNFCGTEFKHLAAVAADHGAYATIDVYALSQGFGMDFVHVVEANPQFTK